LKFGKKSIFQRESDGKIWEIRKISLTKVKIDLKFFEDISLETDFDKKDFSLKIFLKKPSGAFKL